MCYILRWHHTLCLLPAKNTNSSNLVRNSPTSLCTVSRETVRGLMVHFHIAGHIYRKINFKMGKESERLLPINRHSQSLMSGPFLVNALVMCFIHFYDHF